jgi:zona occludens toxin
MAATFLLGIPRSGKSYYAVYQLWKNFIFLPKETIFSKFFPKKKKQDYEVAYTNINQFDFSKSNKIKKLDLEQLKNNLTILHGMYLNKATDEELIEKSKEFNLYKALIVIDECHNFIGDKVDETLVWWITYHGHLFQDLFFITQDLSLVNPKYKNNAEFFYNAVPPSKRLFKSKFRYTQYANSRMANNGKVGDFTIPALQEVYDLYVSGAENKSKSIVHKYLYISAFLAVFLLVMVYIFITSFETEEQKQLKQEQEVKTVSTSKTVTQEHKVDKNDLEHVLFTVNCISDLCKLKNQIFPKTLLNKIISDEKHEYFYFIKYATYTQYFLLTKKDTFNFLISEDKKNEKNKNTLPNLSLL